MAAQVPLSLYVHLPWCAAKCPYCDFNSYTAGDTPPRQRYLEALLRDVIAEADRADGRELVSVFLGGGTPSLFSPEQIGRIVAAVMDNMRVASDVEITMEANPGTVDCGDPAGYRSAGVNRLSLGAQSFSGESLARLGRIHSVDDIRRSVAAARKAGFDNLNLDIMYGLPEQNVDAALADLAAAAELEPEHLSWYQLTLEPNTVFYARPPAGLPGDDVAFAMQSEGQALLAELGYTQYEVSAYSRPGRECRHNLNYWTFGDYLAAGAGAHGKITTADGVCRYEKPANPQSYMRSIENGEPAPQPTPVAAADLMFEFTLNALRLTQGFDEALFESRTGLGADELERAAAGALDRGLVGRDPAARWRPTTLGRRFLDDLTAEFLR